MRDYATVIGNGTSRKNFDLNVIKEHYVTIGCNALYRDFIPDILVSMDIHMVTEIINARIHHKTHFVTQHVNDIDLLAGNGEPIHFIKNLPSTPDSGTAAVEYISEKHNIVYIIGFDYHNGSNNNVYAGTNNYNPKNYSVPHQQDTRWRSRLCNIAKQHSNVNYYRVSDDNITFDLPNLHRMTIQQFKETLC